MFFFYLKKHLLKHIMVENRADCTPLRFTKVNPMNGNWDGTRNVVAELKIDDKNLLYR